MTTSNPNPVQRVQQGAFEGLEFVTLSGHHYVHVHLTEEGWKREAGFLERRHRESPISVDRRKGSEAGMDPAGLPK